MTSQSRIGTTLGGYRIESMLGRGGMSVVYLAEHIRLRRKVALKVLSPELGEDERFRERFVRESQLAASLDHPNIIPIYEADEAEGLLFIAMRYVQGSDLKAMIEANGALEPALAHALVRQVGAALDAAHARGLVHRDVKAANILVASGDGPERTDHVYLSDFGLTKRALSESGITRSGEFMGTVDYAAPEQFLGKPITARADVYSLGCVAFECLTGQVPFGRGQDAAVMYAHLNEPPPKASLVRPGLPRSVDAPLARVMAKSPADRYETCEEFTGALGRALGLSGGSLPPARMPAGTSRRRLALAGAVLAAVVAGALFLLTRGGHHGGAGPVGPTTGGPAPVVRPDSVLRIDPGTGKITNVIHVGGRPASVVVAGGQVWVLNGADQTVSVVDAKTNRRVQTIGGLVRPGDMGVDGKGSIWVSNGGGRTVTRIDPSTGLIGHTVGLDLPACALAGSGASLWVVNCPLGGTQNLHIKSVTRIDIRTKKVIDTISVGHDPDSIAVGGGSVWVANADDSTVSQIDPVSDKATTLQIGTDPSSVAFGLDDLWVANGGDDSVTKYDPLTNRVTGTRTFDLRPTTVVTGFGAVWVAIGEGQEIVKLDPTSMRILRTIQTPGVDPSDIAVGAGGVWVAAPAP